jgi:hypothetical protein
MSETRRPFAWQNRVVATRYRPGWTIEVWNPMTDRWEAACDHPVWPADRKADADAWAATENAEQEARNLKTAGMLN